MHKRGDVQKIRGELHVEIQRQAHGSLSASKKCWSIGRCRCFNLNHITLLQSQSHHPVLFPAFPGTLYHCEPVPVQNAVAVLNQSLQPRTIDQIPAPFMDISF
jgi:hypothetical protein